MRSYAYAIVYIVSVLAFGLAARPEIGEDYVRGLGLAWTVLVLIWIVEVAIVYQDRYRSLPDDRRSRMLFPRRVWGMGIAYLTALGGIVKVVIEQLHKPIVPEGLPLLVVTLAAATYWLWPLRGHEYKLKEREAPLRS